MHSSAGAQEEATEAALECVDKEVRSTKRYQRNGAQINGARAIRIGNCVNKLRPEHSNTAQLPIYIN